MKELHEPVLPPVSTTPTPAPANPGMEEAGVQEKHASRWAETVSTKHADLVFILCSLMTGLCDGVIYASFGCFISMQTGNTVFLGLGTAGIPANKPYGWLKSLTSICGFLVGSFVFATLSRMAGNRRRGTLVMSFAVQSLLILVAAALFQGNVITHTLTNQPISSGGPLFLPLIPIAILSFQCGGQISASRGMGFNELPTVVLTSVYFDIASDPALLVGITKNLKRNRRLGTVVAIVVGAIVGGWLCRSNAEMQSALWISGFFKACIAVAWVTWPAAEQCNAGGLDSVHRLQAASGPGK